MTLIDKLRAIDDEGHGIVNIDDVIRIVAEHEVGQSADFVRLRAALTLAAGSCRAAMEKQGDAPLSAEAHLCEAVRVAAMLGCDHEQGEAYSTDVGKLRMEARAADVRVDWTPGMQPASSEPPVAQAGGDAVILTLHARNYRIIGQGIAAGHQRAANLRLAAIGAHPLPPLKPKSEEFRTGLPVLPLLRAWHDWETEVGLRFHMTPEGFYGLAWANQNPIPLYYVGDTTTFRPVGKTWPEVEAMAREAEQPTMSCPCCAKVYPDFDGVGVVYCAPPEGCGYCRHLARSGQADGAMKCDFCGDVKAADDEG